MKTKYSFTLNKEGSSKITSLSNKLKISKKDFITRTLALYTYSIEDIQDKGYKLSVTDMNDNVIKDINIDS
jgi:hypothetical protein